MKGSMTKQTALPSPRWYRPFHTAEVINANYIMFELPSDIANICALNDYVRRFHSEIKHNLSPNGDVLIIKLFYDRSRCVRLYPRMCIRGSRSNS